jgi:hypothetical protein
MIALLALSCEVSHADAISRFIGTWTGTRTYNLPGLKGTETFTMTVKRFERNGFTFDAVITRPGWDKTLATGVFYPNGEFVGGSGKAGTVYEMSCGRWKIVKNKIHWDWKMYYANLREWTKSTTTWSIDSKGRLNEVRVVPKQKNAGAGRVTAISKRR